MLINPGRLMGGFALSPLQSLISSLFGSGADGGLWLPGPSYSFTDTARTTPAGVGDSVAGVTDLSSNGNHASQSTADARPALGRTVEGGRRNLFTHTEEFDNAAWIKTNATVTDMGDGVFRFVAPASNGQVRHAGTGYQSGLTTTTTFEVKQNGTGSDFVLFGQSNQPSSTFSATNEWQRFSFQSSSVNDDGTFGLISQEELDILIRFPQVEYAGSASNYQRVGASALDVTETGKQELWYWEDDLVDDALTATFGSSLGSDCAVIYADADGVDTLTSQTIGTTYDLMQAENIYGIIVVDETLSAGVLAQAQTYLAGLRP